MVEGVVSGFIYKACANTLTIENNGFSDYWDVLGFVFFDQSD